MKALRDLSGSARAGHQKSATNSTANARPLAHPSCTGLSFGLDRRHERTSFTDPNKRVLSLEHIVVKAKPLPALAPVESTNRLDNHLEFAASMLPYQVGQ
jgi:hypothetical protein